MKMSPSLSFDNQAREAMEFYASVFGGTPSIDTYGQWGMAEGDASGFADKVMYSQLDTDLGFTLMASDSPEPLDVGDNFALTIYTTPDEAEQARGIFEALSEGGVVTTPLEPAPWGDEFGMLTDRFGISWMFNIGPDPDASQSEPPTA